MRRPGIFAMPRRKEAVATAAVLVMAAVAAAQDVSVTQSFSRNQVAAGESFIIEITIRKGDVSGIGKLQQILPEGFSAKELTLNKGTLSQEGRTVKILWLNLPEEQHFRISYEVTVAPDGSGSASIGGRFSYIVEGKKLNADVPNERILIGSPVRTTFISHSAESATVLPTEEPEKEPARETKSVPPPSSAPAESAAPPSAADTPRPAVIFRVQIAASQEKVSPAIYQARYNVWDEVHIAHVNGWYKYSVGSFGSFDQAAAHRDKVVSSHGVSGAFIIAFLNDEYIPVSKARSLAEKGR